MSTPIRSLVACTAAALLAPWFVHPAVAEEGDPATGWWSRTRLGTPLEAPDTVPEGGMYVAAGPNGRLGVSALRAELGADMRATALTLEVADAKGTVAVTVCAAAAAWEPVDGGRLEDAPPEDCTLPAQGAVQDGKLLVPLDPATPAGPLDVVLLPTEGAAFSLTLQPPTAAAVTVEPVQEEMPLPDASGEGFSSGGGGDGAGISDLPPSTGFEAFSPSVDLGAVTEMPPLLSGELPALPGSTQADPVEPTIAGTAPVALAPPALAASVDPREHSVPAMFLLALLIGFALQLQNQPKRAPRALGGAARARARSGSAADAV